MDPKRCRRRSPTPIPRWLERQSAPIGVPRFVQEKCREFVTFSDGRAELVDNVERGLQSLEKNIRRELHVLELRSGFGETSHRARELGSQAHEFDKRRHPTENLNSGLGLFWAGILLLRVVVGGACFVEPECSCWTFLALSQTRRHEDPRGDVTREFVVQGNRMADGLCMLMRLADGRKVHCVIEQPGDSFNFKYPKVAETMIELNRKVLATYLHPFGHEMEKRTLLCVSPDIRSSCIDHLVKPRPKRIAKSAKFRKKGGKRVTGNEALRSSAHYPTDFCEASAAVAQECLSLPEA